MSLLNQFDLAFIVDTTSSMSGLIKSAQKQMVEIVDSLSDSAEIDMQLGVVEYRDHPPQDKLVYRVHDLTGNFRKAKRTINSLRASGGGDQPEAVFAGIVAACRELSWRPHACRMALLVGDAPPHGVGCPGDAFPHGCPSGETMESASAHAEEARVTLFALGLTRACEKSFERMSRLTGGRFFRADRGHDAMRRIGDILNNEFGQLDFDRQVHGALEHSSTLSIDEVADTLGSTPPKVAAALCRLQSRGLALREQAFTIGNGEIT